MQFGPSALRGKVLLRRQACLPETVYDAVELRGIPIGQDASAPLERVVRVEGHRLIPVLPCLFMLPEVPVDRGEQDAADVGVWVADQSPVENRNRVVEAPQGKVGQSKEVQELIGVAGIKADGLVEKAQASFRLACIVER